MKRGLLATLAVVLVLLLGVGWYYSSQALQPGGSRVVDPHTVVADDTVGGSGQVPAFLVVPDEQQARLAVIGVLYAGGYGLLHGDVVETGCPNSVTPESPEPAPCILREFELVTGVPPATGTPIRLDEYAAVPGVPAESLGVEVQRLPVVVDFGFAPAWWVPPADGMPVAVLVHGRGGAREEMLRVASILQPQGYGILIPSYRGDGVAQEPEDGMGRFGEAEWLDVAMAMLHEAVPADARFVLVGYSMGGAIAAELLESADVAERVDALILDSPLLGLDATMQLQARLAGIPNPLVRPVLESAYLVSRVRGFDFGTGERVDLVADLDLPVLLFHGPDDTFVPFGPSERLAALDPDDVTYVRIPGVDHVRFWNHDPAGYADAVTSFLATHLN